MSGWNYRVFKKKHDNMSGDVEYIYTIKGTFYNDVDEVNSWTSEPEIPYGRSKDELKEDLERMLKSLEDPVLDEDELSLIYDKFKSFEDLSQDEKIESLERLSLELHNLSDMCKKENYKV